MVLNNKKKKNKMSTDGIIMYLNIHNFLNTYQDRARALHNIMYTNKKKKMVAAFHAKKSLRANFSIKYLIKYYTFLNTRFD